MKHVNREKIKKSLLETVLGEEVIVEAVSAKDEKYVDAAVGVFKRKYSAGVDPVDLAERIAMGMYRKYSEKLTSSASDIYDSMVAQLSQDSRYANLFDGQAEDELSIPDVESEEDAPDESTSQAAPTNLR